MNGFYENIRMDMIALESAIDLFEVENGITSEYLFGNESYDIVDDPATESASEISDDMDDAFAGLFGDMPAMEDASEGGEAPKEKFGAKLKKGISNVLNSIKNFFIRLGEGIANLWKKITGKKKEAAALELTPAEKSILDEAQDVRGAVKSALGILQNTLAADGGKLERVCRQLNDAIRTAGAVRAYTDYTRARADKNVKGTDEYTVTSTHKRALSGQATSVSRTVKENYDREKDFVESMANVSKEYKKGAGYVSVEAAEKLVEEIEAGSKKLGEARTIIRDKYAALCQRVGKMANKPNKVTKQAHETDEEFRNRQTADKIANKPATKHDGSDIENEFASSSTIQGHSDAVRKVRQILMKAYYCEDNDFISKAEAACRRMTDTCETNKKWCNAFVNDAQKITVDNDAAKEAFALCKVYFKAANAYSTISQYLTMLTSGSIFAAGDDTKGVNLRTADMGGDNGSFKTRVSSNKNDDNVD